MNEVHKNISWRGLAEVCFQWKVLKTWTSVAILSWAHIFSCRTNWILSTQNICRGLLNYISHPVLLPGGPGDKLRGPDICSPAFLQELVGKNGFLKLLSPHLHFQVLLDLSSYLIVYCYLESLSLSNDMLCFCSIAARVS